ncbi:MAG: O-methyltransferase family 2 [Betaproteobacteria bacterium]|nr:O-methyltransferase family 2 [Betaproteobacteria bacterium]
MAFDVTSPDRIMELGHAFRGSKALLSAVELGIFTTLADGPLDIEALRERVGLNKRGARDFLDALVALGMLVRHTDGRFANSPEADVYLDRTKPTYVGGLLESFNAEQYGVWASLTTALRTGKPQSDKSVAGNFARLYADRTSREMFVSGMTARTRPVAKALATRFPWADYRTLVDIGTAEGCLPVQIAQVHPHVTGGGFDLPALASQFDSYVQKHALSNRFQFYPGDFFSDPLPVADVLVLGRVLHNWDLATKKMLLNKSYNSLPPAGALIVYERLIDDERRVNAAGLLSSLNMLLMSTGGFDFTGADCIVWMREAGFRDIRIEPLTADQSMVVGVK